MPLAGALLIGRSVSDTRYVTAATAAEETVHRLLSQGFTSPPAIAIQLASLAAVVLMIKIDWIKVIDWTRARIARMRGKPAPPLVQPPTSNSRATEQHRDRHTHAEAQVVERPAAASPLPGVSRPGLEPETP